LVTARAPALLRNAIGGLAAPGLMRSSGWVLVGSVLARGSTLVAGIVVARIIDPTAFGKMTVMLTAVTLLSGVAGLGLGLAIARQVAESRTTEPDAAGRYAGSALALTAAGGIAVGAALVLAKGPVAGALLQDRNLDGLVVAAAAAVLFSALNQVMQGIFSGLESFRSYATSQWLQGIAAGVGLVAGAAVSGATGALAGFSAGQALAAVATFVLLRRTAPERAVAPSYRIWPRETRALFRYGLPTFGSFLAVSGALLGGQLLLSHQPDGYAQVALFSIAYRWHVLIQFVPSTMGPVLVPMIARLRAEAKPAAVASIFRGSLWGTVTLAVPPAVVIAAAAPLFLGLSGSFYGDHPLPLVILAVTAIFAAINNVLSSASVGLGAMAAWLVSDLVLAAFVIGGAALLVGELRAEGLAIAYLAGYIATDAVLVRPLSRRLRSSA
jgi:O-antigen/teichoic acid export membrane protein